jgi:hypothetical protein
MFLVLLETSGNQNYIFSTNKLKENFGASEWTYRSGTEWVLQAVAQVSGKDSLWNGDVQILRQNLLNPKKNPPIESATSSVEVIVAASGKALLMTRSREDAQEIVSRVTETALEKAPGIDLHGAIEEFNWDADSQQVAELGKVIGHVHQCATVAHAERPGVATRFLQLPIVAMCATSGLPANEFVKAPGENEQRERWIGKSAVSQKKEKVATEAFNRISGLLQTNPKTKNLRLARTIDDLEKAIEGTDWLGTIHADGNGLGEIFLKFHQHLIQVDQEQQQALPTYRDYVNAYRKFSVALDVCTQNAFLEAVSQTFKTSKSQTIPLVPLVLGGDDLTVICGGQKALQFTVAFLNAFEIETAKVEIQGGIIPKIAEAALGLPRLSACAGVAIVKPHFPFSIAYQLSETLMKSAKTVKKIVQWKGSASSPKHLLYPCSALDFHVLYDSSNVDLEDIRAKLRVVDQNQTLLYNKPYVTTALEQLEFSTDYSQNWAACHQWQKLIERVHTLQQKKLSSNGRDRESLLPSNQAHELRQSLFLGREAADAYLNLIWQRYEPEESSELEPLIYRDNDKISLFHLEPKSSNLAESRYSTGFLDSLEIVKLLDQHY